MAENLTPDGDNTTPAADPAPAALPPRRERKGRRKNEDTFLIALVEGQAVCDAAKAAGITEPTAYTILRKPDFQERLEKARAERVARAINILTDASTAASQKLRVLVDSTNERIALEACKAVLAIGSEYRKEYDLGARVERVEARLKEQGIEV